MFLRISLPWDKNNNRDLECWAGEQVSSEVGGISALVILFEHLSDREEIWHCWKYEQYV